MQAMTLSSVVLPEPEGPRRATTSPGATSIEMSRSASMRVSPSPKCLEMPRRLDQCALDTGVVHVQPPSAVAGSALSAARTPRRARQQADKDDHASERQHVVQVQHDAAREDSP